jgi:hypothetical protein
MSDPHFYENLPAFDDFTGVADPARYRPVPDDWHVAVADVVGSTAAIARGMYKQVNVVGAAAIATALAAVKPLRVPFVFGGDGAMLCIPARAVEAVGRGLVATQLMARSQFDFALRVGVVPVADLNKTGHRVLAARYRVAPHYTQAVFAGGGLAHAEALIKDPELGRPYRLHVGAIGPHGRFGGLECRWDDIPSPHEETITLLVQATSADADRQAVVYRGVVELIHSVYGDADACRPVRLDRMHLTRSNRKLSVETKVKSWGHGRLYRIGFRVWLKAQMALGYVLFARNLKFAGVDWGQYQRDAVTSTDFRKFDDLPWPVPRNSAMN